MTMLRHDQQDGREEQHLSDLSFRAMFAYKARARLRTSTDSTRERSAVISRPRMKAPASQAGAACVPSSQSFTATTD